MEAGGLVTTELTLDILIGAINRTVSEQRAAGRPPKLLIDGFPRAVEQAEMYLIKVIHLVNTAIVISSKFVAWLTLHG